MFFFLLLILPGVRSQDPTLPSYLPRSQQLSFNTVQFVQHKPVKKGPILFPNDAPPPPPTPLIVTSRPLSESIARSELNPNNSLAAQSQYHQVAFKPNYLARGKNYEPYSYTLATVTPAYDYEAYADTARLTPTTKENLYDDQEPEKEPLRRNSLLNNKEKDKEVQLSDTFSYSPEVQHIEVQHSNDYDIEFNDDDNNFDFDFIKLFARRNNFDTNTNNSKQFARVHNGNNVSYVQIRPTNPSAETWRNLKYHRTLRRPSNGVARSKNRVQIKGPRVRSGMRSRTCVKEVSKKAYNVIRRGGVMSPLKPADKKHFHKSDSRKQLQLRDAKPLYEFNNIQRQHNTAPKVDHYTYKNTPVQFLRSKINVDEHDYNNENNHGDNYAFSYTVKDHKTGDDFSHSQKSTGSATNGEYRVRLPDGRMQIVSYTADENGYKADVRYDDHLEDDNSIDFDKDKDKEYHNNNLRGTYNQNFGNTYLHRPQQNLQQIPTSYKSNRPNDYKNFEDLHNYESDNDNFQYQPTIKPVLNTGYQFVYPTKSVYIETTRANDRTTDGLSDNNDDYLEHYNSKQESDDKVQRANNDYKFSDEIDFPKDEMVDYSSELDQAYQPYKSKFSAFATNQNAQASVRPPYNELKDLFVTNGRRNAAIAALPVVSTVRPVYAVTPENVVAITPKKPNLYTSIKNIASVTPEPFLFSTPSPSTPRSYLLSTIANLKHQINLANKPVLSDHYINKINKYLTYTNPSKVDG